MRRAGFTLIEMLVAVTVFLIFTGAIYGVYTTAQTAMTRAEDEEAVIQTGRVVLAQLSAELVSTFQTPAERTSVLVGEDSDGQPDDGQADRLTFLTTAHAASDTQVASDLCRVTYSLEEASGDQPAGLYVEEHWAPGLEIENDAEPELLLVSSRVVSFNCMYLPAEGDWESEWTNQTTLPVAVRIELLVQSPQPGAKPLAMSATTNLAMATAPAGGSTDAEP